MQEESVKLRLGQRIRAFLLDRVLCRHHQEQCRQGEGVAADRDLPLAHRFEERRLHLGRGTIDFVGKNDIVKQWPALEFELGGLRAVDLGTGEIGRQQVRCELDAVEIRLDARSQLLDRGGLGQAGGTFDEQVTIGKKGNQQSIHQRLLADDALFKLAAKPGKRDRSRVGFGHVHDFYDGMKVVTVTRPCAGWDSMAENKLRRAAHARRFAKGAALRRRRALPAGIPVFRPASPVHSRNRAGAALRAVQPARRLRQSSRSPAP